MKKFYFYILLIIILSNTVFSHIDNILLPDECGSCHVGHGLSQQPMLSHGEEELCFRCHGTEDKRTQAIANGKLSPNAILSNMEPLFRKQYRHPVIEGTGHTPNERLPSFGMSSITHAECVDCHNPHDRINKFKNFSKKVSGYSLSGEILNETQNEYEICLKCHALNVGYNRSDKSLKDEFLIETKSQHPVTKIDISNKTISIKSLNQVNQLMNCSTCHTNDDPNGPKGPHGSNHKFLLSGYYNTDIYTNESPYEFEFCYSCHDRNSILSNQSFPFHKEHLESNISNKRKGTSCYTCHNSHSSMEYNFLIDFNKEAVKPDSKTGLLLFNSDGLNSGECYLTCHGYSHSPAKY